MKLRITALLECVIGVYKHEWIMDRDYVGIILWKNSLLFFVRKQKTGLANFTNYYSQARRLSYRIPRIICRCDVIIKKTKNYL